MAVTQITRIQHRRGLQEDLPTLAPAELGWSVDSQQLFIGNGTISEGAPSDSTTGTGVTEVVSLPSLNRILANTNLGGATFKYSNVDITGNTITPNLIFIGANALAAQPSLTISYSIAANTGAAFDVRTGTLKVSFFGSSINWEDDYTETADMGITLTPGVVSNDLIIAADSTNPANARMKYSTMGPDFTDTISNF